MSLLFSGGYSSFRLSRFPDLRRSVPERLLTLRQWPHARDYPFTVTGSSGICTRFPFTLRETRRHSNSNCVKIIADYVLSFKRKNRQKYSV